jgi:hemerythrin-like metal-binding protein
LAAEAVAVSSPLDADAPGLSLGLAEMDDTHREFVELLNHTAAATGTDFTALLEELVAHTEAHFESEQTLMEQSGFPAREEHIGDHQRILGQLVKFRDRLREGKSGMMARAYVREQLPGWFQTHLITMDSALVAHLAKP